MFELMMNCVIKMETAIAGFMMYLQTGISLNHDFKTCEELSVWYTEFWKVWYQVDCFRKAASTVLACAILIGVTVTVTNKLTRKLIFKED